MIKQNPFSLYDFLGYFIPGGFLIYSIVYVLNSNFATLNFDISIYLLSSNNLNFTNILFFVIVSYILGHAVNYLSSLFIEKYSNWIYDYPSKYLLKIQKKFNFRTISFKRLVVWIIILPISLLDLLFGQLFGLKNIYVNPLDDLLIHCIKQKGLKLINKHYKLQGNDEEIKKIGKYDFFRIFQHYTFENTQNHQFKMTNYVVLYGFLRSLTMIFVIIFWYILYLKVFEINNCITYAHITIVCFFSYLLFMAFMKFYRRYTLEALMLIAIDENIIK